VVELWRSQADAVPEGLHRVEQVAGDLAGELRLPVGDLPRLLLERRMRVAEDLADRHGRR
jgi:hypothetical protein